MCGIIAYIGNKNAKDILIHGLQSLGYRGYDSAGIALTSADRIEVIKTQGKVAKLEEKIAEIVKSKVTPVVSDKVSSSFNSLINERLNLAIETSTCGIGHTRWATHGVPSESNAHPHQDQSSSVALVHNGIIKNYFTFKQNLEAEGVSFRSETDSEVIAHLFARNRAKTKTDLDALRETIKHFEGSFAIAILVQDAKKILLAKNQAPLVIGIGDGENYVASDSGTVLQYTDKILKLKDFQVAEITGENIRIEDIDGASVKIEIHQLAQAASIIEKGQYKHFLLKEINEQSAVISLMLNQALADINKPIAGFENLNIDFKKVNRIIFSACGSAYHAALIGKYLIETLAKLPVEVAIASEFCSMPALVSDKDLVIGVSQSGETADTLAAIKNASKAGAQIMSITNKADSAIYDLTKPNNYVTPAGIEVSVASTKAFTSQVMALYLLAIKIAEDRLGLDFKDIKSDLRTLPLIIDQVLERADIYREQFVKYSNYRDFLFLGRGINYPIALEGALKLKEISYIHATGYPSGEMKHGPIAILDENVPVLSIAIDGETGLEAMIYKKTLSNAEEARARRSPAIVVACDDNQDLEKIFDEIVRIPNISQVLSPIIAVIPLQFLAYYIADDLGKDVDQPRNLAKSVTVE